jgi:ABC-2 type transport system ATP-binding protein
MKQRLGIAVALVHDPELVILDEPTNGLDPQGIADIRQLILSLSRDMGKTVLVSSHLLSEIEQMATRMIILDKGKKMVEGSVDELLDPAKTVLECSTTDPEATWKWFGQTDWVQHRLDKKDGLMRLRLPRNQIPVLARALSDAGFDLTRLQSKNSLEDYFLTLTGTKQHD